MCYHAEFGINTGESQNLGVMELCTPWMGGVAGPNIHARPRRVIASKLIVRRQDVRRNQREPPKFGSAGTPPLEVGAWLTPKKKLPRMCYHVKFGSSVIKALRINRKDPQNWRALEVGTPSPWVEVWVTT